MTSTKAPSADDVDAAFGTLGAADASKAQRACALDVLHRAWDGMTEALVAATEDARRANIVAEMHARGEENALRLLREAEAQVADLAVDVTHYARRAAAWQGRCEATARGETP